MPLRKGRSNKVKSQNIKEMMNSSTFAAGKSPEKRQQMAVAAAYEKAGESREERSKKLSKGLRKK